MMRFTGYLESYRKPLILSIIPINNPLLEFAYQGPLLRFKGKQINFVITGDVVFKLIKKEKEIQGNCYESYLIEDGDKIDIISTNKSVYGYLAISGKFNLKSQWGSYSINTKANIGGSYQDEEGKMVNPSFFTDLFRLKDEKSALTLRIGYEILEVPGGYPIEVSVLRQFSFRPNEDGIYQSIKKTSFEIGLKHTID